MAFLRPTSEELIERILSDLETRLALDGATLRRSAVGAQAYAEAAAVHLLHGHLEYLSRQIFPDLSDAEYLERQASLFKMTRIAATYAKGNVTATGTTGTIIPAGTVLQRADGATYTTDAQATIAAGTATIAVTAQDAGEDGNADLGVVLTFVSPVAGVNATVTVATGGLALGTDAETDTDLRARLIGRLREPPHGGTEADYVMWAKEVAGVTRAWVYPGELGAGKVTVRFVRDNDGSGAAIIPSAAEVTAVQDYINPRKPLTANVNVVAPVAVTLNFTIHVVPDTAAIRAAVQAELEDMLARDAKPAGTILLSQIRLAVGVADGVTDFSVTAPAADVTHTTGQIAVMGTITWT